MSTTFRTKIAGALLLGLLCLTPASADTINMSLGGAACATTGGLCSVRAGATTIDFDGVLGGGSPYQSGIATYTFAGGSPFVQGGVVNSFAAPPNDETTYLSAGSINGSNPVTITFSMPILYFGFYLGSPDSYNQISFFNGNQELGSFTGTQMIPPGNGDQSLGDFVNFDIAGAGADRIVMTSNTAAFETDNHAFVATPEPGSLVLFGTGLILLGSLGARLRKK